MLFVFDCKIKCFSGFLNNYLNYLSKQIVVRITAKLRYTSRFMVKVKAMPASITAVRYESTPRWETVGSWSVTLTILGVSSSSISSRGVRKAWRLPFSSSLTASLHAWTPPITDVSDRSVRLPLNSVIYDSKTRAGTNALFFFSTKTTTSISTELGFIYPLTVSIPDTWVSS